MTKRRWQNWLLPARRKRVRDARVAKHAKIHLGCGMRIFPGWINVDGDPNPGVDLVWDLRRQLPFPGESAQFVYCEHTFEHIPRRHALTFLRECFRILEPGGLIRLGMPDAELYLRAYADGDNEFFDYLRKRWKVPEAAPIDLVNHMFRMNGRHEYAWDFVALTVVLEQAGFQDVKRWKPCEASCPEICLDNSDHAFESIYVEAIKPNSSLSIVGSSSKVPALP
jgi:predicted SAM-dependent methyltransferase